MSRKIISMGDTETADVILRLVSSEGIEHPPLYVHSDALRRSEFFDARLSERWTSTVSLSSGLRSQATELNLRCSHDVKKYVKCIENMYCSKNAAFSGIGEALSLLEISSELLFHEGVNWCMRYIESVPWSIEEECRIRSVLASLQIQVPPDISARLSISPGSTNNDFKPVEIMGEILGELLALVSNGAPSKAREIIRGVLRANDQPDTPRAFANVNKRTIFKELQSNVEIIKTQLRKFANFFSWNSHQITVANAAIRWLLEELFALGIAEMAVKMFSEEQELAQLMVTRIYQNPFTDTLYSILVRLLQALKSGEVVCAKSIRLSLVVTWLPVIAKLTQDDEYQMKDNGLHNSLEEGLSALVSTLPMIDQEQVFKIWISSCLKSSRRAWPDLSLAFDSWCDKLRQVQSEKELAALQDVSVCTCNGKNTTTLHLEGQNSALN
eukprot:TRINITY_DN4470_c0_g1_i1.p1 TRINITY_DN4470_c0_g1~~TRINITY_DN4470_c0_g1_i1.p1  ORF type:complete len:441 (+),score=64.63 TRINITY_DN4470_c0_g1_i1:489-1811(+)